MTGILAFAFGAGMLSTVNPCGFAMLPAFLAYYLGQDTTSPSGQRSILRRAVNGLRAGVLVSLGFAAVFTLTGLLVALGLHTLIGAVPWAAVLIGVLLAAAGIAMLAGHRVGLTLNSNRINRPGRGPGAMIAFGTAYAVASLSCTLAVLLAVIAQALATGSTATLITVFIAYAAGASTILILLALSSALASGALTAVLHRAARYIPRIAGAVLVISGGYLIAYWAPALLTGQSNQAIAGTMNALSSTLTGVIGANTYLIAVLALTVTVIVLLAALRARHRTTGTDKDNKPLSAGAPHQRPANEDPPTSARSDPPR
ncbi:cytochrome c biogenesis CcdA family protein [Micrococcaceae bacterium Sec5.7]